MIEVKNVSKEFVSQKKYPGFKGAIKGLFSNEKEIKKAVDGISFNIKKGEIVGYIGSNGAGKSTTIKMMTGILAPTSGECFINGVNPSLHRKKNAKNIGVVFGQRTQLWWDLPVSESYTILKEIYNVSDEQYSKQMEYLDSILGLNDFWTKPVRNLSLGQRMRADLGAALLHSPAVLFLDEPTIGLDIVVKDKIREAIKEINRKSNTTVILTTHDIGDIEELCDRIIIIDEGHKIFDGTLEDVLEKHGNKRSVQLEVKKIQAVDINKLCLEIGGSELVDICTDEEKNILTITFEKNKVNVSELIAKCMKYTQIRDMQIKDTELSEIVKDIYQKKAI